ncbi:hypothetical protein [Streptomyces sp. NBC_01363]|uniref:hypothetical protein n=1 Tax=Streptomyces sp. NBC_01363 TaxID=2903840 RepID=UPI00224DBEFA|nr:hypothetical protein [Streptomyces sp. NBC_01363]MCX4735476.1 hypothetical protein [Streptomyces sp. NBC_01363]
MTRLSRRARATAVPESVGDQPGQVKLCGGAVHAVTEEVALIALVEGRDQAFRGFPQALANSMRHRAGSMSGMGPQGFAEAPELLAVGIQRGVLRSAPDRDEQPFQKVDRLHRDGPGRVGDRSGPIVSSHERDRDTGEPSHCGEHPERTALLGPGERIRPPEGEPGKQERHRLEQYGPTPTGGDTVPPVDDFPLVRPPFRRYTLPPQLLE